MKFRKVLLLKTNFSLTKINLVVNMLSPYTELTKIRYNFMQNYMKDMFLLSETRVND